MLRCSIAAGSRSDTALCIYKLYTLEKSSRPSFTPLRQSVEEIGKCLVAFCSREVNETEVKVRIFFKIISIVIHFYVFETGQSL